MNTVAIPKLDVKVWTLKSEFPQGNFLRSLTKTEITRQITLEITYIEYDWIKDKITSMECVEYNTAVVINVSNFDDV